jgi:hypothetical protein
MSDGIPSTRDLLHTLQDAYAEAIDDCAYLKGKWDEAQARAADARDIARELLDAWDKKRESAGLAIRQRVDWLDDPA